MDLLIAPHQRSTATLLLATLALGLAACSATRSHIRMDESPYPVSLSPLVRATDGEVYGAEDLQLVGDFTYDYRSLHMLFGVLPMSRMRHDLAQENERQVADAGGEAVVNLEVTSTYNSWTGLSAVLRAGVLPAGSTVEVRGDIVRLDTSAATSVEDGEERSP